MTQQNDPIEYERPEWTPGEMPRAVPFDCARPDIAARRQRQGKRRGKPVSRAEHARLVARTERIGFWCNVIVYGVSGAIVVFLAGAVAAHYAGLLA